MVQTIDISHPKELQTVARIAEEHGVETLVVGGFVRDFFLGRERKDIDITVLGDALAFAQLVANAFDAKIVVYERFRTALVPVGDIHLEFVGTRKEEYIENSRKPIVTEGTLDDDIRRRDFTVNAMAARLSSSGSAELVDLYGGVEDLNNRILRTPLEPEITFSDDPLRMMRAARFASQLGFDVAPNALDAMSEMADRIKIVSQERIADEFLKILASPTPSIGLNILFDSGLMRIIFPEVHRLGGVDLVQAGDREYAHKDVFLHTLKVVDNIAAMTDNVWLRFAALMHDIAKPKTKKFVKGTGWTFHGHEAVGARWMKRIFKRMKFPLHHLEYVERLVALHQRPQVLVDEGVTDSALRRLAVQAGDCLEDLFTLCRADITTANPRRVERYHRNYDIVYEKVQEVLELDKLRAFQSPVRGEEIMSLCNIPPSREVGVVKTQIEEAILEGLIPNEYDAAKEFMLANVDRWLEEYRS